MITSELHRKEYGFGKLLMHLNHMLQKNKAEISALSIHNNQNDEITVILIFFFQNIHTQYVGIVLEITI